VDTELQLLYFVDSSSPIEYINVRT